MAGELRTKPNQTGLVPLVRCRGEGWTTTTLPSAQGPRQSERRTGTRLPDRSRICRRSYSWASWSVAGYFFAVPQQQPRQTTIRQLSGGLIT